MLLRGTQAVAQGDLSPKPELDTGDELGMLTRQFNMMTKQLSDARDSLQESKSFLETVLGNLTAGVCIFDNNFNLASSNPGAAKILGRDLLAITGKPLTTIPELIEFDSAVREGFATQNLITSAKTGEVNKLEPVWQKQIQINPVNEYENDLGSTLFVRGTQLSTSLKMIVFDDISDVVAAQRSIAWSEVARRLAHEIKNPLTPIQLSAERLQQKLVGKLSPDQDEMLERSTNTIIGQVQAMKQMVNEFRDFAKTPSPTLGSLDLNILIQEVMGLYEGSNIEVRLDSRCPRVMGDPTQLRQVIHNLLQNAQDASLESHHAKQLIEISTELVEIHDADQNRAAVRMTISDSGPGFQAKILARAFEPYITTKAKGTGLGLAVVKKIIDDHGAKIEIRNRKQGDELLGAQVSILFINLARGAV
jgi:nitrogen fixation/metabolism regulation signal transduction histidine kinase